MLKHFDSFAALMTEEVLPLHKRHLDWIRLDGKTKEGNQDVFATFRYQFKTWKIHSDTLIAKLLVAFELGKNKEKPFVKSKTPKGNWCLRLSNQKTESADGLYIYEHEG